PDRAFQGRRNARSWRILEWQVRVLERICAGGVPVRPCYQTVTAEVGTVPGSTMAEAESGAADGAADVVARLKRRIVDRALPLWSTTGWDGAAGGFVDRLHQDGTADRAAPRRIMVQARQIYCYAKAAQLGWYPDGRAIALKGLDYLLA